MVKKYLFIQSAKACEQKSGNRRSDGAQPLAREFQADAQQFLRHLRLPLLEFFPLIIVQQPGDRVFFRDNGGGPVGLGEERELAARGPGHDGLVVFALGQIIPCAEDTVFQQVETVGPVATLVECRTGDILLAFEERTGSMPEVFVLVRQALKRLKNQG